MFLNLLEVQLPIVEVALGLFSCHLEGKRKYLTLIPSRGKVLENW